MTDTGPSTCGACAGVDVETPARVDNPPGQSGITYRVSTHATFKDSMVARLSDSGLPALAALTTRDQGDFTIALCDALATTLDVLTFYQERIANESFLRTATERLSVVELARLIGYRPSPGVAASTHLAFSLQEAPGSPDLAAKPVEIPIGTKVQSVPGPGEMPQTFETTASVEARVEWNAIPVQQSIPWHPRSGDRSLWLSGVGLALQTGDAILIVGQERLDDPGSERWDIRLLVAVDEDRASQRTRVGWDAPLGHSMPKVEPADVGAAVYVFRLRAGLFGHNSPDPRLMNTRGSALASMIEGDGVERTWKPSLFSIQGSTIDLDSAYPKITPGSWFALVSNEPGAHASGFSGYIELYRASSVRFPSRTDFGLSGKITRIAPDVGENLDVFRHRLRETLVLAQPDPLGVAATPLDYPLFGDAVVLACTGLDIAPGRALAFSGKRARLRLRVGQPPVTMQAAGGVITISERDSLRLLNPPERQSGSDWQTLSPEAFGNALRKGSATVRLRLLDRDGTDGTLVVSASAIELVAADSSDDAVQEIAFISSLANAVTQDRDSTNVVLAAPLIHCYDRATARVNANVAPATHGETVSEIVGSGDSRRPNAAFVLRQSPVTFVSAATPSGRQSTVALRANDLLWQEVDSLYARGPVDRVFATEIDANGQATLRFGDGIEGARLPSGDHNVRATYRKGLGLSGNVAARSLTNLLSRPLGVTGATNPIAATGGEDAETIAKARDNAPLTVLTLDRAVSIRDYRDFARAFAGIAKAHAVWIGDGPARGVFLTVAGEGGAQVTTTSDTLGNLQSALQRYGDPSMPLAIRSYRDARFRVRLSLRVAGDADSAVVLPAVEARLRDVFGFDRRSFGDGVSVDAVAAVVQDVPGVEAVQIVELHRTDAPTPAFGPRLFAALPIAAPGTWPLAAELLTLESGPLTMELMS